MQSAQPDSKILDKIKKCLALASSDNANEAATALRQAHALMAKHGVCAEAIHLSDIGEARLDSCTMARNKPAQWEASLASVVGSAFGCKLMVNTLVPKDTGARMGRRGRVLNQGGYIFVGLKAQVEIAAYTAQVLVRRCKRARAAWIAQRLGGLSEMPGGKRQATLLGNEFAMGWVAQIARLVREFALSDEMSRAIDAYVQGKVTEDAPDELVRRNQPARGSELARMAGRDAAQGERLHRPVQGSTGALLALQ
ncbi:DUF2786 domain-containing protein [Pulveribacter sp.]|uniref:DUF2786 domain-containing protein n=1 Tax=Pulveribacter sp. TaxID=2678893 RepID=UPI0028AB7115|nr:DUF2786 domain-containing protein [Pulveribacter sp.]